MTSIPPVECLGPPAARVQQSVVLPRFLSRLLRGTLGIQLFLTAAAPLLANQAPWPGTYKIAPFDRSRLTEADVVGPSGKVFPDFTYAGVPGGIPSIPVVRTLSVSPGQNISTLIEQAAAEVGAAGGGAIQLPEGTFNLESPVFISANDVVLRGEGADKTRLLFTYRVPAGELIFFRLQPGQTIGPSALIEIQANPRDLVALELRSGPVSDPTAVTFSRRVRADHWGNTFSLRISAGTVTSQLGTGVRTVTGVAEYSNGARIERSITLNIIANGPFESFPQQLAAINFIGRGNTSNPILLAADGLRGRRTIRLPAGHGFTVGQRLSIEAPASTRWRELVGHTPTWNIQAQNFHEVIAVSGQEITLNQPLRHDFLVTDGAFVRRIQTISGVGVEDLALEQVVVPGQPAPGPVDPLTLWHAIDDVWTSGITTSFAWGAWMRGVTVENPGRHPAYFLLSKHVEVRDCTFISSLFKGGGGTAYVGFDRTWDSLMENISATDVRHGPNLQWNASGNVIRNGRFLRTDAQWHAGWTLENLFENNIIDARGTNGSYGHAFYASGPSSSAHGPQGPRNVVYNNDVIGRLDGLHMLGGNEGWLILHNRFDVGNGSVNGRAVYAQEKSFDHIIEGNVFILRRRMSPAVALGADSVGIELVNNAFFGVNAPLVSFAGPGVSLARDSGNTQSTSVPATTPSRPTPAVPSIFQWQRDNLAIVRRQQQAAIAGHTAVPPDNSLDLAGFDLGGVPLLLLGGTLGASAPTVLSTPLAVLWPSAVAATANVTLSGPVTGPDSGNATLTIASGNLVLSTSIPASVPVAVGAAGTLSGAGNLAAPLSVAGRVSPSGVLSVPSAEFAPTASLNFHVSKSGSNVSSGRLQVSGTLQLGGRLVVRADGDPLAPGDVLTLFSASMVSGSFASFDLPFLTGDLAWDRSRLASHGELRVVTFPAATSVAERRERLLAEAAASPGSAEPLLLGLAAFARGDDEAGRALVASRAAALAAKVTSSPTLDDTVPLWLAADLAIRHSSRLDTTTINNLRTALTRYTLYQNATLPHHRAAGAVARYLGNQAFGSSAFTSLGIANFWRSGDVAAASEISNRVTSVARTGFPDHASRPYIWQHLLPMLSVAQLATTTTIRDGAALAYEAGLAQHAPVWLRGHLAVLPDRAFPDLVGQRPTGSNGLFWFHFGGPLPPVQNEAAFLAAAFHPTVSPLLELAASDRSAAFASRSLLAGAHRSAWIDSDYALFTDGPTAAGGADSHPGGVSWTGTDPARNSLLWLGRPVRDDATVSTAGTHGRNPDQAKETLARDAILHIFNIPAGDPLPYALAHIPGGHLAAINESASGQIFLHYGTVLVALRSEHPFTWSPETPPSSPSTTPAPGDSELRLPGTRFAVALETARPADFEGTIPSAQLAAFRAAVLARPGPASSAGSPPFATYTTRHGNDLRVALSADPASRPVSLDGAPVNFNAWPVLESPWTFLDSTGPLVLRSSARRELLDFTARTRSIQTAPSITPPASATNVIPGQSVDVDLSALATPDGAGSPAFLVREATGGSALILPDGRTARFTAGNTPGPASFRFAARSLGIDPSRLVWHYDYETDQLATNTVPDISGHGLNGGITVAGNGTRSLVSDVPSVLASSTRSLQLDKSGTNAARLRQLLSPATHDLSDSDWSFATWFWRSASAGLDTILYIGSGDGFGGSGEEFHLYVADAGALRFDHYNSANAASTQLRPSASVAAQAWHHVAVTFTRTGLNTGTLRFFLNGTLVGTRTNLTWTLNQSGHLIIGGVASTASTAVSRWFGGRLDDTALFSQALPAGDVADLARVGVRHFTGLESTATVTFQIATPLQSWRQTHFGTMSAAGNASDSFDADGDGFSNLAEYALGTTPVAATSRPNLPLTITGNGTGQFLQITFDRIADPALTYRVEGSNSLAAGSWSPVWQSTGASNVAGPVTVTDPVEVSGTSPPQRFLRLNITRP